MEFKVGKLCTKIKNADLRKHLTISLKMRKDLIKNLWQGFWSNVPTHYLYRENLGVRGRKFWLISHGCPKSLSPDIQCLDFLYKWGRKLLKGLKTMKYLTFPSLHISEGSSKKEHVGSISYHGVVELWNQTFPVISYLGIIVFASAVDLLSNNIWPDPELTWKI